MVVACALFFVGLDVLVFVLGSRSTGPLGPYAALVFRIALDLASIAVVRAPRTVLGVLIGGSVALLVSELVAPGALVATPVLTGDPLTPTAIGVAICVAVQLRHDRTMWVLVGLLTLLATRPWDPSWSTIPLGLLYTAVPALIGRFMAARRTLVAGLRERAERAEREQLLLAEQARGEERARMAAEMHDVVTHRVSLMVLQAGAMEVTATDPATRSAAGSLRAAGVQALDELREIVGVFGGERVGASPAVGPQRPRARLADLVDASIAAGVPVELVCTGAEGTVPASVARTAHRVVQEALTNVHKHAPGGTVCVEVRYGPDAVTVAVRNTAPTRAADGALTATGSGSGLRGLRERVEVIGGALHAAPSADGGFEVRAELPMGAR